MNDINTLLCKPEDRILRQAREIGTLRSALQEIASLAAKRDTGGAGMIARRALLGNVDDSDAKYGSPFTDRWTRKHDPAHAGRPDDPA